MCTRPELYSSKGDHKSDDRVCRAEYATPPTAGHSVHGGFVVSVRGGLETGFLARISTSSALAVNTTSQQPGGQHKNENWVDDSAITGHRNNGSG